MVFSNHIFSCTIAWLNPSPIEQAHIRQYAVQGIWFWTTLKGCVLFQAWLTLIVLGFRTPSNHMSDDLIALTDLAFSSLWPEPSTRGHTLRLGPWVALQAEPQRGEEGLAGASAIQEMAARAPAKVCSLGWLLVALLLVHALSTS